MRRILVPLALVVIAIGLIIWLRGRDGERASAKSTATQTSTAKRPAGPRAPAKPATLSGRVTRTSDGAGVTGAIVSIAWAELGADFSSVKKPTIVVTTDASGAWTAKDVAPGDYMIAATAKGLLPSARDKLSVASAEQRSGIDFVLAAGGTRVAGTVSDVLGGPIASARITARREAMTLARDAEFVTLTGEDGSYELALPDGSYRMSAAHDDYTRETEGIEVEGTPVTVDFTLIPGGVIRGQVIARDTRKPVPGALVMIEGGRRSFRSRDSSTVADADGQFVVRGLSSGSMSIEARGRGYASSQPTVVQVGIGEQLDGIQVLVDGAFSITGRVVKKGTQEGIAAARIGAFSMNGKQGEAAEPTDADGAFEISGLQPGNYMLYAAAEGSMLEIGKSVEIIDRDVHDVLVELGAGVTLSGRVDPPAVAAISLELEGEIGFANMFDMIKVAMCRAESDASGAFTLRNVPPGTFQLAARTKEGHTGKLAVTVANVDRSGLVVLLAPRASIAGRVIDTNGKPVAGIEVSAHLQGEDKRVSVSMSMSNLREGATSSADGTFKIVGLDAGTYEVRGRNRDDFSGFMRDKDKDKNKKRVTVELAEGAEKTGVTITVEARDGVIRGVVIGADNKPAADSWVTARMEVEKPEGMRDMPDRFSFIGESEPVLTNAEGRFTIDKLKKGKYTLVAEGPRGISRGEKAGVNTGDSATIQLASLGTLTITVTQQGKPVAAYDVSCDGKNGDVERHVASADGSYAFDHLAPGDYTCKVRAETGTAEGKVAVPAGDATLALALASWGSLTGVVVSVLTGKPVPDLSTVASPESNPRAMLDAIAGQGAKTDATGRFVVEKVPAGKGRLLLIPKAGGFANMDSHEYTAKEAERVDLGTIKIVPPRVGDAATFGLSTDVEGDVLKVTSVKDGGPAAIAGVQVGDTITALEGQPIKQLSAPIAAKLLESGSAGVGQTIRITLERGPTIPVTAIKW